MMKDMHALFLLIIINFIKIQTIYSFWLKNSKVIVFQKKNHIFSLIENKLDHIHKVSSSCVNISLERFRDGSQSGLNSKDQMGTWLDQELLANVVSTLNKTTINEESPVYASFNSSKVPIMISLLSEYPKSGVELTLFYLPVNTSLPPRRHLSGTVLFYMLTEGSSDTTIQSFTGNREISTDYIDNKPIKRLGGPTRVVRNAGRSKPSFLLECAIYPPKGSEFGDILSVDGFDHTSEQLVLLPLTFQQCSELIVDRSLHSRYKNHQGILETRSVLKKDYFQNKLSFAVGGLNDQISKTNNSLYCS